MPPVEAAVKKLDEKFLDLIGKLVYDIKSGKLQDSNHIALATLDMLEQIIIQSQDATAFELCASVRGAGRRLAGALPHRPECCNMARRLLRVIRDEGRLQPHQSAEGGGDSLQRLVRGAPARRATLSHQHDLREPLRDHIAELRLELESSGSAVCGQAREQIRGADLVLCYGHGALLESFLRAAKHHYRLVVAEGPDHHQSHAMCARLAAAGVSVTLITSAAVFAVMSRVNKVVFSASAALGGGAALGPGGLHSLCGAAKHYSVPVLALAPLHTLVPLHSFDPLMYCALDAPPNYPEVSALGAQVLSPVFDFVPPDHITLFITNQGACSPSYIYRLLDELYDHRDQLL